MPGHFRSLQMSAADFVGACRGRGVFAEAARATAPWVQMVPPREYPREEVLEHAKKAVHSATVGNDKPVDGFASALKALRGRSWFAAADAALGELMTGPLAQTMIQDSRPQVLSDCLDVVMSWAVPLQVRAWGERARGGNEVLEAVGKHLGHKLRRRIEYNQLKGGCGQSQVIDAIVDEAPDRESLDRTLCEDSDGRFAWHYVLDAGTKIRRSYECGYLALADPGRDADERSLRQARALETVGLADEPDEQLVALRRLLVALADAWPGVRQALVTDAPPCFRGLTSEERNELLRLKGWAADELRRARTVGPSLARSNADAEAIAQVAIDRLGRKITSGTVHSSTAYLRSALPGAAADFYKQLSRVLVLEAGDAATRPPDDAADQVDGPSRVDVERARKACEEARTKIAANDRLEPVIKRLADAALALEAEGGAVEVRLELDWGAAARNVVRAYVANSRTKADWLEVGRLSHSLADLICCVLSTCADASWHPVGCEARQGLDESRCERLHSGDFA